MMRIFRQSIFHQEIDKEIMVWYETTQGRSCKRKKGMACASDDDDDDVMMCGEGGGKELFTFQKALKVDEISHLNRSEQSHNS